MLTENEIEQQETNAKAMQELFETISAIALKYEGTPFIIHDEIQVFVPKENYEAFLAEVENANMNLDGEVHDNES